ncbi:redoxin domain-containing protein [Candidatus Halobeggiatoa sp. HSG11]|nr:redoxin domain-containing protein [Candidatus Halobeggiatoa sp. HSG11]
MRNLLYLFLLTMSAAYATEKTEETVVSSVPSIISNMLGKPAPNFTLKDTGGESISLHDFKGKHVILEWFNPDCRRVQQLYQNQSVKNLIKKYVGKEVIWLAINSSHYMNQEDNKRWRDINLLPYRLLGDFTGETAKLYQVQTTPQIYIINSNSVLVYQGAFDDDPDGNKSELINYVEIALEESLMNKPISKAETKPYGCLVKYKY